MVSKSNRGFTRIFVLLLAFLLVVPVVYFLVSRGVINNPFSSKSSVALQTQYQNPFDKGTQYANPFSQYKNPFDVAK